MVTLNNIESIVLDGMCAHYAGKRIKMTGFDPYGYCGRDMHPQREDIGFEGEIVEVIEVDMFAKVTDGQVTIDPVCCFLVEAADGRRLELMSHEIEVLP